MKASFYKKLQDDFVMIRFMQYQDSFDREKYDSTVLSIREARKKINMHSAPAEKNTHLSGRQMCAFFCPITTI